MNNKYPSSEKMPTITKAPGICLSLMGRMDSKKGESVAQAHVDRYLDKCAKIECGEYEAAESAIAHIRQDASVALGKLVDTGDAKSDDHKNFNGEDVYQIREHLKRQRRKRQAKTERDAAREMLYRLRPEIIRTNTLLSERVTALRKDTASKIDIYVKGLRKGGLEFEPDLSFSNAACEKYHADNDAIDNAVERMAYYEEARHE